MLVRLARPPPEGKRVTRPEAGAGGAVARRPAMAAPAGRRASRPHRAEQCRKQNSPGNRTAGANFDVGTDRFCCPRGTAVL
jgi:hypothetical protein